MSTGIPPVIVVGMHRSGTSLVTRMLDEMGLFTGWRKDINHEAWFFLRLNDWLLRQCGGAWDHPEPVRHLLEDAYGRRVVADYLRFVLSAPRAATFLGPARYLRYRGIGRLDFPWGWKDPRNTYTLPLWLALFPDARVIHVCRHGVDVAASLQRRQAKSTAEAERRFRRRRWLHGFLPKWGGFAESWRCADPDRAVGLWAEYVHEARRHVAALGSRAMEVRYEDLLQDPGPQLAAMARFCGLSAPDSSIARAAGRARASRALAFRKDPSLLGLAERWRRELRAVGY